MKTALLTAATLAAMTASAAAESYDATSPFTTRTNRYLDVGAHIGTIRAVGVGFHVDGGYRLGQTSLFAHANISAGYSGSDGDYQQVRVGIEARGCAWFERICVFGGVDVGYQRDRVVDEPNLFGLSGPGGSTYVANAHDVIAVPRFGFEIGAPIKLRLSLETPVYGAIAGDIPMSDNRDMRSGTGATLMMSLVYSF